MTFLWPGHAVICMLSCIERFSAAECLQALGCLLYYLAYGKLAFMGEAKLQVLNGDFTLPPRPQRPQPMKDLIRLMLTVQPAERPDIDLVLGRLGSLATGLKVDTGAAAAAPQPGVTTPAAPNPRPHPSQGPQPLSANPHDLVSTPVSASGHVLPARRASSGSLKVGREGSGVPPRSSSPAVGMAPLSPQHSRQTGMWLPCPQPFFILVFACLVYGRHALRCCIAVQNCTDMWSIFASRLNGCLLCEA